MGRKMSCRETGMGLLARREHSRKELQAKLSLREFSRDDIEQTLDTLETDRLLSDRRFAEAYVRFRSERGFGPLRIRAELRERGVAEDLVDEYLIVDDARWLDLARAQHRKKYAEVAVDFKERAKQARFLQGRGFSGETISNVLNNND